MDLEEIGFRGDRLKDLRITRGWSQLDLAERAGISQRSVSDYETGGRRPQTYDIVARLAVTLGANPRYLMGEDTEATFQHKDHVSPEWLHVVNRAMALGFSPSGVIRLLEAAANALHLEPAVPDRRG